MRFKRPSAAWLVAVIALLLAMGTGSAVGAQLITGAQIKNNSITGRDIKNRSITGDDISDSAATVLSGEKGEPGPVGPAGPAGPAGPPGPSQVGQITRVEQVKFIPADSIDAATATCPPGQGVIGGGYSSAGAGVVFSSDSFGSPNSWAALYDNLFTSVSAEVHAFAYCAPSGQAAGARAHVDTDAPIADAIAAQRATHQQ